MEQATVAPSASAARRRTSVYLTAVAAIIFLVVAIVFATQVPWYVVFKMIHVGAAVIWVGGGLFIAMCAVVAELANDDAQLLQIGRLADQVAAKVFPLMSFVVLGFGIAMTANGDIGYNQFWIIFGLVAWVASAGTGILFLTPETKRLTKAMTERGPEDPEVQSRLRRIMLVLRFDTVLMFLIVLDMVAKPFT
jgi:uncharacterized membrane protein